MPPPKLSLTCCLYDRTLPLYLGQAPIEGFDVAFERFHTATGVRVIFDRIENGEGADITEYGFADYMSAIAAGDRRYVALPVFLSRTFRTQGIFIRSDRIKRPEDLNGRRIGVPLFIMTAAVLARGFLSDEYGFNQDSCSWVQGAMYTAGRHGTANAPMPIRPMDITQNSSAKSLSQLLADGEIDATIGPFVPDTYRKHPTVQRLFPDYRAIEKDYFKRSGVFPIMHLLAIRREVHEKHPTLAQAVFDAFTKSKDIALARMKDTASLEYMLPWLPHDVEEIDEIFGGDPWPYGVERNRRTLEAQSRYLWEQGITATRVSLDDMFAPVREA